MTVAVFDEDAVTDDDLREMGFVVERAESPEWGAACAIFGPERDDTGKPIYRYSLSRCWGGGAWRAYVMLNPSTADAFKADPTVTRCLKRAKTDGMGGILVVNIFAFRSPHPTDLLTAADPVGPLNDDFLMGMPDHVWPQVVVGWGTGPSSKAGKKLVADRARIVGNLLAQHGWQPHALYVNDDGSPKHPLYCAESLVPVPWAPRG